VHDGAQSVAALRRKSRLFHRLEVISELGAAAAGLSAVGGA
jgi:hypothetical protein